MALGSFDGVVGGGLHHPFKIICTYTGRIGIGCRIAKINGIGNPVPYGQFYCIEIITEVIVDFEDQISHLRQLLGIWMKIGYISEVVGVARLIGHDSDVFAPNAIAPEILLKNDLFLDHHNQLTGFCMLGKEIFPASVRAKRVMVHLFDGYWEDIGTIRAFYEANLQLTSSNPPFELAHGREPIYSRARFLPPTRFDGAKVSRSLIADGCHIEAGAVIEDSVIGVRCRIGRNAVIRKSVLMGADFFQTPEEIAADCRAGRPPVGVGDDARIEGAIVDKNCRIGRNARVLNESGVDSSPDLGQAMICDGIVVIPKEAELPAGWSMPPQ